MFRLLFLIVILVVGFILVENGSFSFHRWRVFGVLVFVVVFVWRALTGNKD